MSKTILVLGGLLAAELRSLEGYFKVLKLDKDNHPETVLAENKDDIVAIIATPSKPVSAQLIEALPNLELITQFGTGTDNIDKEAAAARNITVTNTPDLVTADTADIALLLMLGVARRGFEADLYVRIGKWMQAPMGLGHTLTGKTAAVLGMGKIGKAIAKRAAAFDMNVIYNARSKKDDLPYEYCGDIVEMSERADFFICAVPGGAETNNIVDAKVLDAIGAGGYLINIARGSVVDQEALVVALHNKKLAGAGLDVYQDEPCVPEGLVKMDNVCLLPHIGTATFETRTKMGQLVVENIRAHFDGKPVLTPVAA